MKKETAEWLFIFLLVTAAGIVCLCNASIDLSNPFGIIGIVLLIYAGWIFINKLMMRL